MNRTQSPSARQGQSTRRPALASRAVEYTADAHALAKEREQHFLDVIVPKVLYRARQRFSGWSEEDDLTQEALGFSWLNFVAWHHHHPTETIGQGLAWKFARWAVARASRFQHLAGRESLTDVLSAKARRSGRVTIDRGADLNKVVGKGGVA